ncbi:unnamed protein product [Rhodiola kirilowii]
MASPSSSVPFVVYVLAVICLLQFSTSATDLKSYIVYLGTHSHGLNPTEADADLASQSHYKLLGSILGSETAQETIFYSYNKYINGFAAMLNEEQVRRIADSPGVICVFESKQSKPQTTRSWEFLGLEKNDVPSLESLWKKARYGEDTIIGNLDTGVWPESASFNDEGLGPVPSRWRGGCVDESDHKVQCNKKLIGAKYFNKGYQKGTGIKLNQSSQSARDTDGHGTHTLSTAGGSFVVGANVFGFGNGTAKGGSPRARVASYKVCWPVDICDATDILAGFEAAIDDGVDILSVSLNGPFLDYIEDTTAIGAFHAVRNGITVVASAGNTGPGSSTATNIAPWFITVGASSMDRQFTNWVTAGNNLSFKGENLGPNVLPPNKLYPVIDAASAKANSSHVDNATICLPGSLDPSKVKGKIVVCLRGNNDRVEKGQVVLDAGGVGFVLANDFENGNSLDADTHFLPASHISYQDGQTLLSYIHKSKNLSGHISKVDTEVGTKPAPAVVSWSSRGPNLINEEILKPDVIAPGVDVIAAYTDAIGPSDLPSDKRRVKFNTASGTSMSCPHVAGIAGLLKTLHPDWSPAAISSAIITTAITLDNTNNPILDLSNNKEATSFSYGAGHINPNAAADPGLVYDLTEDDYLNFLCAHKYKKKQLKQFSPKPFKCSQSVSPLDLNYPSIAVPKLKGLVTITREVKNVGTPGTYTVNVTSPPGVSVVVSPTSLRFGKAGESKKFSVSFKAVGRVSKESYVFGNLLWSDGKHYVRSTIAVKSG